jgi:FtsZ-binding cell division protein ZapB
MINQEQKEESITQMALRLVKENAKLSYELDRAKDTIQMLQEEIENLDTENSKLHQQIEVMEKI